MSTYFDNVFANRGAVGTRLSSVLGHQVFSSTPPGSWHHPWFTRATWNPTAQAWSAVVTPGFVNGQAPSYRTRVEEQTKFAPDFGINPLTGERYFSASLFSGDGRDKATSQIVDIPLYLAPSIPLAPWRALGLDGDPQYPVPQFFLDRGVPPAPKFDTESLDAGIASIPEIPSGRRLLRACDVWLHQPRLALTSDISLQPGILTGSSNVRQTLSVRGAAPGDALRVQAGTFRPPHASFDPLTFDYDEPNFDELLIATVYLLSPPDAPTESKPDGSWTPYVRHSLFWNLHYEPARFRPKPGNLYAPFIPPLAGGVAQLAIGFLSAGLNDMAQQALNILTAHTMAGTFYTPTGGGYTAAFPPATEEEPAGQTGLDKDRRIAAEREATQRKRRAEQLDPDFPFRAEPFSAALLS